MIRQTASKFSLNPLAIITVNKTAASTVTTYSDFMRRIRKNTGTQTQMVIIQCTTAILKAVLYSEFIANSPTHQTINPLT